jgi:hypothetical protein
MATETVKNDKTNNVSIVKKMNDYSDEPRLKRSRLCLRNSL